MSYIGYNYGGQRDYSEATAQLIDSELRRLMDEAIVEARAILTDHKDKVEAVVKMLLEKEVVEREEFDAMF
jgi:cell division protease FtsH